VIELACPMRARALAAKVSPVPPSPRSFEEKRTRIAALAGVPAALAEAELRRFLADKNAYLCGDAAKMAGELRLGALAPDLAAAFQRFLVDPVKTDKGCVAKRRIVEALLALDVHDRGVYLAGIRHVQLEPPFPEAFDAAATLRGLCAHALVHSSDPDALLEVGPLLADREAVTRAEAASALGAEGSAAAGALVHLKIRFGDPEPDVLGACFRALLKIDPRRYLPLVASALADDATGLGEVAALAIGETRPAGGFEALTRAAASTVTGRLRDGILVGVALLRSGEGNAFLIDRVLHASEAEVISALSALSLHRHDTDLAARVRAAVATRKSRRIEAIFADRFGA
jgi:HEAT repeat protein